MLDHFEILTTSGVVLFSRNNGAAPVAAVNSLISEVFIEENVKSSSQTGNPTYKYEKYTLRYTTVKELGLIFVAVYQSLLGLTGVNKLLDNIKLIFVNVYKDQLQKPDATIAKYDFDPYFDQQLKELNLGTSGQALVDAPRAEVEGKKVNPEVGDSGGPPPPPTPTLLQARPLATPVNGDSVQSTPIQSPGSSRPTTPIPGHLLTAKDGPKGSRRARKAANVLVTSTPASSGDESKKPKTKSAAKNKRVWGADGYADEDDGTNLDYSATNASDGDVAMGDLDEESNASELMGTRTKQGAFVLNDIGDEVNKILKGAQAEKDEKTASGEGAAGGAFGTISGYFRNLVGGKTLTKQDLEKPLKAMEDHLVNKNVAREAAVRLCEGVEAEMIGKKTGTFENIDSALRPALENSLRKILTPKSSLELFREIDSVNTPPNKQTTSRPYVISIVGVNGVGKSTNLSKICYLLLQNKYRVLVAAGDTFRSGAVEQLNVHVKRLKELTERQGAGEVDLFQKGYGKDAANVAKEAVTYAAENDYNVVLIDTAGRRHNDARLMGSLEKFAELARPDKILMVGEALVGSDAVMQAKNFNKAFGQNRSLDGFIISKCDTVGDMIGTLVSMVHATGIPVVFLGVGQHYADLRTLSVPWAVKMLMA
jgi:signal recognition particle receptor subunit alpha